MTWLAEERSQREATRTELAELRQEVRADVTALRQEMRAEFAKLTASVTEQIHGLDLKLSERIHAVDNRVLAVKADLMKWSLVFWVSAVGAIAALAGVLK